MSPRTFFFAGKAAPGLSAGQADHQARSTASARAIERRSGRDAGRIRVVFLPELQRDAGGAADPGDGCLGADLDCGLRGQRHRQHEVHDERRADRSARATARRSRWPQEAGEENLFLVRPDRASRWPTAAAGTTRSGTTRTSPKRAPALDLIAGNHFSPDEPGVFEPLRETLLTKGDYYMHLADLTDPMRDAQRALRRRSTRIARPGRAKAILNVASIRQRFSSDRTITRYATDIWHAKPCPVREAVPGTL